MSFKHQLSGTLETNGYTKDGLLIQNYVTGVCTSSENLVPWLTVWRQIGYIDIPHAGTWQLDGIVRWNCSGHSTHWLAFLSWSTTSAAAGANGNSATHNAGNIDAIYFRPCQAIFTTSGSQRIYLNGMGGHASGGTITIEDAVLRAFRIQ